MSPIGVVDDDPDAMLLEWILDGIDESSRWIQCPGASKKTICGRSGFLTGTPEERTDSNRPLVVETGTPTVCWVSLLLLDTASLTSSWTRGTINGLVGRSVHSVFMGEANAVMEPGEDPESFEVIRKGSPSDVTKILSHPSRVVIIWILSTVTGPRSLSTSVEMDFRVFE